MAAKRYFGGVKPRLPWREPSGLEPPRGFVPSRVVIPLSQGAGKPAEPVVQEGERVLVGQLIGEAADGVSARCHASVSGTVEAVAERPKAGGGAVLSVVIRNDNQNEETSFDPPSQDGDPSETVREAARLAGILGMGGAGFPGHLKLKVDRGAVQWCLINGAECEPGIEADEALMIARAERVVRGAALLRQASGAERMVFAVEDDKPEAIAALRDAVGRAAEARVLALPRRYPMGGEKQLIYYVAGREVPEGCLPSDVGVVVFNVASAAAVADAVDYGRPLVERLCTVAGDVARPQTVRVPVGSLAEEVLAFCGGAEGELGKVVLGGPMMGKALDRLDIPLVKTSNGLVAFARAHDRSTIPERPCIRCDRCSRACPMRLMPQFLDRAARRDDWSACRRLKAGSCINCGCCTYVCPARIPLARNITDAAKTLKKMDTKEDGDDKK